MVDDRHKVSSHQIGFVCSNVQVKIRLGEQKETQSIDQSDYVILVSSLRLWIPHRILCCLMMEDGLAFCSNDLDPGRAIQLFQSLISKSYTPPNNFYRCSFN